MARKPLVATVTDGECFIPLSHKLNGDGYFRKRHKDGVEMFHRTIWKHHGGTIPEGYEIDHKCRTRACFNVEHLRCIPREVHLNHTNRTRYIERYRRAFKYWSYFNGDVTGVHMGEKFGVSNGQASRWIRDWKAEENDDHPLA